MPSPTIRPMTREDLPQVVAGWNAAFGFDPVDEAKFGQVVFDDPNYDPQGVVVAAAGGRIAGAACCVARESIAGRDGKGVETDADVAHLQGIFHRDDATGRALLRRAGRFARAAGKAILRVVQYRGGPYFFCGIDLRYEGLIRLLAGEGFEELRRLQDVCLDLKVYAPGRRPYQRRQWRRVKAAGIRIEIYRPEMAEATQDFTDRLGIPSWFGPDWRRQWARTRQVVVAVIGDRVVGFSRYAPAPAGSEVGQLGPIGTLEAERGRGAGSCMLDECMRRMKEAGTGLAVAQWANTPFYLANGWTIYREYAVMQKHV